MNFFSQQAFLFPGHPVLPVGAGGCKTAQSSLILEEFCFEPDQMPEGMFKGTFYNPGGEASPIVRLLLTLHDESDRTTSRAELAFPSLAPGRRKSFTLRHRLKNTGFFRYQAQLVKIE